jgi:hypothetical protein
VAADAACRAAARIVDSYPPVPRGFLSAIIRGRREGLRHLITERCVFSHASLELLTAAWLKLIMKLGPLTDAVKPGIHRVRTHWIRGFMAFHLAQLTPTVMPMVPM